MTIEEMKKRLRMVKVLDDKVNEKLIRLHELKLLAGFSGGMSCEKDRVQTSLSGSKLEEIVCKIVDLEKEINQDTNAFIDYSQMVLQELRKVTGQEQEVLMQKYIMYRSNYEISQVLNIHKSTVKRKLKSGIQTLLDK